MEYRVSFDKQAGAEIWRCPVDTMFTDDPGNPGPRSTPTVEANFAFFVSSRGTVAAVDCRNGSLVWQFDFADKFQIKLPRRGFTTSPIVVKNLVIFRAGGGKNAEINIDIGPEIFALFSKWGQVAFHITRIVCSYLTYSQYSSQLLICSSSSDLSSTASRKRRARRASVISGMAKSTAFRRMM